MRLSILLFVLCAGFCGVPAHAETTSKSAVEIVSQQQEIREEIQARAGRYKDMPGVKRESILKDQDRLFALLAGKHSIDELDAGQRVDAFNVLQSINAAINNKEDERVICEARKPIGSNRTERVCRSLAQIKADRDTARKGMQGNQGICNSDACRPGSLVEAGQQR
jgi:hypothetical protein